MDEPVPMKEPTLQEIAIRLALLTERGFEQHEAMKDRMALVERRIEALEASTTALVEATNLMRTFIFGDDAGSPGLADDVHAQTKFNGILIRLLWIAATVGTVAAVTGLISLAKAVLAR